MPEALTVRRVPRRKRSTDYAAGDFAWHPPGGGEEDTCDRVLRLALPVYDHVRAELRKGGWPSGPAVWFVACPVSKAGSNGKDVWGWDGNIAAPSLDPSIQCWTSSLYDVDEGLRQIEVWHGFLRGGVLTSC